MVRYSVIERRVCLCVCVCMCVMSSMLEMERFSLCQGNALIDLITSHEILFHMLQFHEEYS